MMEIKIIDPRITKDMVRYHTKDAAAIDLYNTLPTLRVLYGYESLIVHTGIKVWIGNPNLCGLISLRSSILGGVIMPNAPGIVDADYQGEILVHLLNIGKYRTHLRPLERIAQLTIVPLIRPDIAIVEDFSHKTNRGEGGFGSTGRN